jgi:hypothetical protein
MIQWETCKCEFEWDGALCDIYVPGTTIEHWRALYDMLLANYSLEYFVNNVSMQPPPNVDGIFAVHEEAPSLLKIPAGNVMAHCHFFTRLEIEFNVHPRDVISQSTLDDLLGFLRRVGDSVGKPTIVTPENCHGYPFISYEPSRGQFVYHAR